MLPLEHDLLGLADRSRKETGEPCGKQNLARAGGALEARRPVDDVADRREVVHGGVTDVADERLAEVEADTDSEVRFAG